MEQDSTDSIATKALDVWSLLPTNQCVPDIHHQAILARVKSLDAELETMDEAISELKARLRAEESNREEKWQTRQAYAGLVSPMRRLPTELLSKVFTEVMDCPRMISSEDLPGLNSLHLVCRRWKDVVRSTPDIWTSLSIILPPPRKVTLTAEQKLKPNWIFNRSAHSLPNIDRFIAFVDAWFDRAGTKPLRLRVDGRAVYPRDTYEFGQREVVKLSSFIRKRNWLQLDFYAWVDSRISMSCKRTTKRTPDKNPFETLETLQLWSHPEEDGSLFPSNDVPNLKSLHVINWATFNPSRVNTIQHEGLQSLHLSCANVYYSLLAPTITDLPSLKELILSKGEFNLEVLMDDDDDSDQDTQPPAPPPPPTTGEPPSYPPIESLILMGHSSLNAVEGLILPSLKYLRLCKMKPSRLLGQPAARWCTRLNEFLERSKATLEVLSLELSELSSPDLFAIISRIPATTVILPSLEPFFLTSRVPGDLSTPPIMNLQHVVCAEGLCKASVAWKVAFDFLKARAGGKLSGTGGNQSQATPLTIHISSEYQQQPETVARCQDLAAWKDGIIGTVKFEDQAFFEGLYPVIGHCFEGLLNDPKVVWKHLDRRFAWHSDLYAATASDRSLLSSPSPPPDGLELEDDLEDEWSF